MMTTPKTPVRAKVQRELGTLASEVQAIGRQMDLLQAQLDANQERTAKLTDFLQTLAEFESPDTVSGRRPGSAEAVAGAFPPLPAQGQAPAPPLAAPPPLAVPVTLTEASPGLPGTLPDTIKEFVARELAQVGELSTRDLVERIRRQGYVLPGRDGIGELSAILSGSGAFRSENRLWYLVNKSLPGQPLDAASVKAAGASSPVFGSSSLPGPAAAP